jgi:TPR repeat protein
LSVLECKAACDANNANACIQLGEMYQRGERVPRDRDAQGGFYRRACLMGALSACVTLEQSWCGYSNGPYNDFCAPVFHQSCALGPGRSYWNNGCILLAGLRGGFTAPAEESRFAFERLRDVCATSELSTYDMCHELARAPTTPPDIRRVALERICHSNNPGDACGRLRDLAIP